MDKRTQMITKLWSFYSFWRMLSDAARMRKIRRERQKQGTTADIQQRGITTEATRRLYNSC